MTLFPKFITAAGISFGAKGTGVKSFVTRAVSARALAKRGMLGEIMATKIPFDYTRVGVDTGLNYAIKLSAQGRKRIHEIGWVPKRILEQGYGRELPLFSHAKARVVSVKGTRQHLGLKLALPTESTFTPSSTSIPPIIYQPPGLETIKEAYSKLGKTNTSFSLATIGGLTAIGGATLGVGWLAAGKPHKEYAIEGLREDGISSLSRKEHTDFGSPLDKARLFAKMLGQKYPDFLRNKEFRQTLLRPTKTQTLGPIENTGLNNIAIKMHWGKFRGEEFQFIEKIGSKENILREASILNKLQSSKAGYVSPSVYGYKRNTDKTYSLISEAIGGKTLGNVLSEMSSAGATPANIARRLQLHRQLNIFEKQLAGVYKKTGITHGDLSMPGNLMVTPKGIVGIDWALANTVERNVGRFGPTRATWSHLESLVGQYQISRQDATGISPTISNVLNYIRTQKNLGSYQEAWPSKINELMAQVSPDRLNQFSRLLDRRGDIFEITKHRQTLSNLMSRQSPYGNIYSEFHSPWNGPIISGVISKTMSKATTMVRPSPATELAQFTIHGIDKVKIIGKNYSLDHNILTLSSRAKAPSYELPHLNMDISRQQILSTALHQSSELKTMSALVHKEVKNINTNFNDIISSKLSKSPTIANEFIPPSFPVNTFDGLQARGLAQQYRHLLSDFGSPWRGPVNSGSMSASLVEGGFTRTSPELRHIAETMPKAMSVAPNIAVQYMKNNVPLSTKISIKGTSNTGGDPGIVAQAIQANIPKSKVNIHVRDHRMKLTPQEISDMIDR